MSKFRLSIFLFVSFAVFGQQTGNQIDYKAWLASRQEFRIKAVAALDAESAREKQANCPDASSTRDDEECLTKELSATEDNYRVFTSAIRALLNLRDSSSESRHAAPGPSGTPLSGSEQVKAFDAVEREWKRYVDAGSNAAYGEFKGGTLAPVFGAEARLRLMRSHLHELAFIYGNEIANH